MTGRLPALGRAALFVATFFLFLIAGVLMAPGIADADLPAGDGLPPAIIAQFALALLAALAATGILRVLVERRAARGLGFPLTRKGGIDFGGGILAGMAAMLAVVAGLAVVGVYEFVGEPGSAGAWAATVAVSLAAFAIPAAAEEAVFRGYFMDTIGEATGPAVAVGITSLLFAIVHGGNPAISPLAFVNLLLAGVLLAVAVLRTGDLWLATGVHLGWNWAMAGPLDLPVSGLDAYDAPLYDALAAAPDWLSGGEFGPEGGLAGTAAAVIALLLVLRLTRTGAPMAPDRHVQTERGA